MPLITISFFLLIQLRLPNFVLCCVLKKITDFTTGKLRSTQCGGEDRESFGFMVSGLSLGCQKSPPVKELQIPFTTNHKP